MSLKETIDQNARQLPYIEAATIDNVSAGLDGATAHEIVTQYGEATCDDPIFARAMQTSSDTYVDSIGISGRTTGDILTYIYDKHPILDYLKGVATAHAMLAEQYQANGVQLPTVSSAAESAFVQKQSEDTGSINMPQALPTLIRNRLSATGCGEGVLDALTARSVSILEQVGALWAISLYVEQATIPESSASATLPTSPQ